MISPEHAAQFAQEWIAAWNSHDLERILNHYTNDFEMTSPFIVELMNQPTGTLKGKQAVGEYWAKRLAKVPDLHFEILQLMVGVASIVIYYKTAQGRLAAEIFFFDDQGKVAKAVAHHYQELK